VANKKKQPAKPAELPVEEVKPIVKAEPSSVDEVPGKAKVYVKTYGCSHNISDSEYMAGLLAEYGFTIVDEPDHADACLLNSCTVKNPS
jgi:threonylcarbamoyladenosine tRNA methylthiotransferase CDKAL1